MDCSTRDNLLIKQVDKYRRRASIGRVVKIHLLNTIIK